MRGHLRKIAAILCMVVLNCVILLWFDAATVFAASCTATMTVESERITVDSEYIVTLKIDSTESISGVELLISYDKNRCELISASPAISGEEGYLKVNDIDIVDPGKTTTYKIKFRALQHGTSYLKIVDPVIYGGESEKPMSVGSSVLAVDIVSEEELSNNTDLKELKVSGGELKPVFSNDVTEYTVTMEKTSEKILVSAVPEDSNAKVNVTGPKELEAGENPISVIVTAENGETKEYKIIAICEVDESVNEDNQQEETEQNEDVGLEEVTEGDFENANEGGELEELPAIHVKQEDDGIILETYKQYQVVELPDKALIPEGYKKSSVLIEGETIPIYKDPENGYDFVLIYLKELSGEPGWYQYDRLEQTIQRLNDKKISVTSESVETIELNQLKEEYQDKLTLLSIIIMVGIAGLISLTIVILHYLMKERDLER